MDIEGRKVGDNRQEDQMTDDFELEAKSSLAREIAERMAAHDLTPLHLAKDAEAFARYEMILRGDVGAIPYMTLLRASGAVQNAISPLQMVEDDGCPD